MEGNGQDSDEHAMENVMEGNGQVMDMQWKM